MISAFVCLWRKCIGAL